MSSRSSHAWLSAPVVGGVIILGAALTGCAPAQTVAACPQVPQMTREDIPKPPVSETLLIWQPSHWDWNGATYTLVPGAWVQRQGPSNQWLDGYWTQSGPGAACVWSPAHWL